MPISINNKNQLRVQLFNRGQNSNDSPLTLKTGSAQLIENGEINKVGDVVQRKGTTRTGDNPDTLISRWNFNDRTANDVKASNNGVVTSVTFSEGKFGRSAEFNGSSSLISIDPGDTSFDAGSIGDFRLSAWVYVDTDGENDVGRIFDHSDSRTSPTVGYWLNVEQESSSTVILRFNVQHATTDAVAVASTTMSTGAWHKVDALLVSSVPEIYIDGVEVSYTTQTTGAGAVSDDSGEDLIIGNSADGSATFDGKIDEARFYDGTFTASELVLDKVQGLTRYEVGTTIDRVYRVINTSLQRLDDNFKGWTNIDTGFTTDLTTNFVQAGDLLFILNGTDNVHSMDSAETITDEGNTNTDPPRTTVGEYMSNNRLFLSGSKTIAERDFLWFSDTLAPQTFVRDTNVIKVRSGGGGAITWLAEFKQDELVIYKEDSIFMLFTNGATPLTDWLLRTIHRDVGCKAGRTVANLSNEQIFLDSNGDVRLLTRTEDDKFRNSIISDKVKDVLNDINFDSIANSCAWFFNNKYYLFFPTGANTEPNKGIVWDSVAAKIAGDLTEGWSTIPDSAWAPSCFTEFEFSDNAIALLYGDNRDLSLVHRALNGNNDDGKTIVMKIRGPLHTIDYVRNAIFGPLNIVADSEDSTSLTLRASKNNISYQDVAEVIVDSSDGVNLPVDLPFDLTGGEGLTSKLLSCLKKLGRSKGVSIEIEHNQYNKTVSFKEYTLWAKQIG